MMGGVKGRLWGDGVDGMGGEGCMFLKKWELKEGEKVMIHLSALCHVLPTWK